MLVTNHAGFVLASNPNCPCDQVMPSQAGFQYMYIASAVQAFLPDHLAITSVLQHSVKGSHSLGYKFHEVKRHIIIT